MLYLVRHGQTYWNAALKMQGRVDIPLNDVGREQAAKAGALLDGVHLDAVYASPFSRTVETAKIVLGDRDLPIIRKGLLVEQAYGLSEGLPREVAQAPGGPMEGYGKDPANFKPDIGGESFEELRERAQRVISEILIPAEETCENTLVVAHGALFCSVYSVLLGLETKDFWKPKLENGGIGRLRLEKGKLVVLPGLPQEPA